MTTRLLRGLTAAVLAATAWAAPFAQAQDYPGKPITLIVPFGPGSGTDQQARVMAQFQAAESRKWGEVIRAAGIQPE
jgi:tripartite-type tricarboxylate transporter receptor subunit TctC